MPSDTGHSIAMNVVHGRQVSENLQGGQVRGGESWRTEKPTGVAQFSGTTTMIEVVNGMLVNCCI